MRAHLVLQISSSNQVISLRHIYVYLFDSALTALLYRIHLWLSKGHVTLELIRNKTSTYLYLCAYNTDALTLFFSNNNIQRVFDATCFVQRWKRYFRIFFYYVLFSFYFFSHTCSLCLAAANTVHSSHNKLVGAVRINLFAISFCARDACSESTYISNAISTSNTIHKDNK